MTDKLRLYTIRDIVAGEFGPVYESKNDEVAVRQYQMVINKTEFKDDYTLYYIGDFDKETGILYPVGKPVDVLNNIRIEVIDNETI